MKPRPRIPLPHVLRRTSYAATTYVFSMPVPKVAQLVREARARGARVVTGGRMLSYQGVLAQRLWSGREPNAKAMGAAIS